MRRRLLLVVALLCLAEGAAASPAEGIITVEGAFSLPAGATLSLAPLAVLQNDTAELRDLRMHAERATLVVYEVSLVKANAGGHELRQDLNWSEPRTHRLRDASILLAPGNASGSFGIYPQEGALLQITSGDGIDIHSSGHSTIAYGQTYGGGSREARYYANEVEGKHLVLASLGSFEYAGGGDAVIHGPDVRVTSARENFTLETGEVRVSQVGWVQRWAILSFDDGALSWRDDDAPGQIAARAADAEWEGVVAFHATSAQLRSGGAVYAAEDAPTSLDGRFSGTLSPLRQGESLLTALRLQGVLASTSFLLSSAASTAPASGVGVLPWLGGALVGLALAGGAVVARSRARRADREKETEDDDGLDTLAREAFALEKIGEALAGIRREARAGLEEGGPEELAGLAREALARDDFQEALAWLRRARRAAPSSVKLRMEEAYCLGRLGDEEGALHAYQEAAALSESDGEPDFFAALALVRLGRDQREAEAHFEKAMEKSPEMAPDVDEWEDEFGAFLHRPRVRRAIEAAMRRLGREGML